MRIHTKFVCYIKISSLDFLQVIAKPLAITNNSTLTIRRKKETIYSIEHTIPNELSYRMIAITHMCICILIVVHIDSYAYSEVILAFWQFYLFHVINFLVDFEIYAHLKSDLNHSSSHFSVTCICYYIHGDQKKKTKRQKEKRKNIQVLYIR